MSQILLCTLNAKYIHASFGLRYLHANMQEMESVTKIIEFNINQRPLDIAEKILSEKPKILGLGVYIWNISETLELVEILKKIAPDIIIVLGGPEVSYEYQNQIIVELSDYTITGEADLTFRNLCRELLLEKRPAEKIIKSPIPKPEELNLPYHLYTEEDAKNRVIYVEASRGCPFTCEFCLSSLDIPVRQFELPELFKGLEILLSRGVKQFKFVDRTFNLNIRISKQIMEFFLERYSEGMFIHFEMVPDRLPDGLKEVIKRFPAGALQFEVGIQTFNPEVSKLINRRQDYDKIAENIKFLRTESGVHIHADLIAGLPGETIESFAEGFNQLVALNPQEIQVGILKRLKGTPIIRHDKEWKMIYSESPPFQILSTSLINFAEMQQISRFSRYWDLCANSGHFVQTLPLLWQESSKPFQEFMKFTDWLYLQIGQRHGIALQKLSDYISNYLINIKKVPLNLLANLLSADIKRTGGRELMPILKDILKDEKNNLESSGDLGFPKRQSRHVVAEL